MTRCAIVQAVGRIEKDILSSLCSSCKCSRFLSPVLSSVLSPVVVIAVCQTPSASFVRYCNVDVDAFGEVGVSVDFGEDGDEKGTSQRITNEFEVDKANFGGETFL